MKVTQLPVQLGHLLVAGISAEQLVGIYLIHGVEYTCNSRL